MRQLTALEVQGSLNAPLITGDRLMRRLKHSTRHHALTELRKHLAGTGYALRATNAQMKAGAKTLYAIANKRRAA